MMHPADGIRPAFVAKIPKSRNWHCVPCCVPRALVPGMMQPPLLPSEAAAAAAAAASVNGKDGALASYAEIKQKNQKWIFHRKLRVATSTISSQPRIQY